MIVALGIPEDEPLPFMQAPPEEGEGAADAQQPAETGTEAAGGQLAATQSRE